MMKQPSRKHFLRRSDARHRLNCSALIVCRGVSQKVEVVDFSSAGLRVDGAMGLAPGDRVLIAFAPDLSVVGTIAWAVWHKAGVKLSTALGEKDPVYAFLTEQAARLGQTESA